MSLLKRIAAPLMPIVLPVALLLGSPQPARAQTYIEAGAEAFSSFEKSFQDTYGVVPLFDLGIGFENGSWNYELNFKFGAPQKTVNYGSVTDALTFTFGELDLRAIRLFGNKNDVRPYVGFQGSLNFISEHIDETSTIRSEVIYDSELRTGLGGGVFAGVDFPLDKSSSLFGEAGFNYAAVPVNGKNFNAGGLFAKIGGRAKF